MPQTATEKILSRVAGRPVRAGDIISPEPEFVVVHDWYAATVCRTLERFGVSEIVAPERVMFCTDHEPLAVSPEAAIRQKSVREFARKFKVGHFYDVGRGGLGHIFPVEKGLIRPGMYVAAYDTHVPNYGAVGALGIPFLTEIADVLTFGSVWLRVPHTVRVTLTGRLNEWVSIRDLAQKLIGDLDSDITDYSVVEYDGSALEHLDVAARFTLCNTPLEIGAKSAIVRTDRITAEYLAPRGISDFDPVESDEQADFALETTYDLGEIEPQVALPPLPDNVVSVTETTGVSVQQAFIGSCASGMLPDLRVAARVLRGRKVNDAVRLYITPATYDVMSAAAAEGLLEVFAEAGAMVTAPGCGPCAAGRIGPLAPGETSINTGTRNDSGRLGPSDARIYLAAPATVACAAVAGEIVDPREMMSRQ